MMWIDGVDRRCRCSKPTSPPASAMVIFGIPAAMQQQRYSPIVTRRAGRRRHRLGARVHRRADPGRRDRRQRRRQRPLQRYRRTAFRSSAPPSGSRCWSACRCGARRGASCPARSSGSDLPAVAGARRIDDAGAQAAGRIVAGRAGTGLRVGGVRQHSADRAGAEAGRLRLGLPRVRGRLRRLDDLVRLVGGRRAGQHVSRGKNAIAWVRGRLARHASPTSSASR